MKSFAPHLEVLPPPQRAIWPELDALSSHFVLYGGTAIALQLGGRVSVDFDFFSSEALDAHSLARELPLLVGAQLVQSAPNTAAFLVERQGPVRLAFFGGLTFGRVGEPSRPHDRQFAVASLPDLGAQKVRVVQVRAEKKDYLDLDLLIRRGFSLESLLGAAAALYPNFAPAPTLKALSYFEDGDLPTLPVEVRNRLETAAGALDAIPPVAKVATTLHA